MREAKRATVPSTETILKRDVRKHPLRGIITASRIFSLMERGDHQLFQRPVSDSPDALSLDGRRGAPTIGIPSTAPVQEKVALRSGIALLSVVALCCLSLEVELLQQIDTLRLYLTAREIALEAGVALLFSIAIACSWWLLILLVGRLPGILLRNKQLRLSLHWYLWLAAPLAYLILDLFKDFKLAVFPRWHSGLNGQALAAAIGVTCICVTGFVHIGWRVLQRFCRTRLVPIAWFHIVAGIVAALVLWMSGVRLFRDYELPWRATAIAGSPDIYLITIDTLRAEDMSVYGYRRTTTPNLGKFSERSFIFDHYFANSNFTTATTTSIESGKLPWSHRVFHLGGFLRDKNQQEILTTALRQHGYYTAMVSANSLAAPFRHRTLGSYDAVQFASPLGLSGFQFRGFNLIGTNAQATLTWSLLRGVSLLVGHVDHLLWHDRYPSPAEAVFRRATDLLERPNRSQPIFLWTHIFPPHDPYWVPPPYRNRFVSERVPNYDNFVLPDLEKPPTGVAVQQLRAAYDEMILYVDHSVGEFLDWLDRTGRLERSIVIVSADHGELFDHNRLSHAGPDLYNGVIHIPLIVHLPGQQHSVRIEQLAQQADLLPTLLDLIGVHAPSWTDGTSLKPALEARSLPDRYVFSMNLEPDRTFDPVTKGTVAMMDANFKFVRYLNSGKEQLYRYKTDSAEEDNLVQSEPAVAERMRTVLLEQLMKVNQNFSGRR
jgi:arylsulfatase A-like enzyme